MSHESDLVIVGVTVGLASGVLIAILVFLAICWYRRHANLRRCAKERSPPAHLIDANSIGTTTDISVSPTNPVVGKGQDFISKNSQHSWWSNQSKDRFVSASGIPKYSYKDIQKATQNFTTILGQGSFGPVYKATMPAGGVVAAKVLAADSKQGEKEFYTEVSLLARLHHRNLVNLIGFSMDKGQHMLIYEFMSNGSLANLLYNEGGQALSWGERLQIALDISHGIEYLHDGAVPPVIHRDLKSANILLDHSMRAKVSDFGLSKEEVFDGRNSGLRGTYGYIDPTYIATNNYTMKSDIYSFGVILFELITSIHPHQNLMEYVNLAAMSPDGVDEIVDQKIIGACNPDEVRSLASIAHKCLRKSPRRRPSIAEVSQAILKIKQRRLNKEDTMSLAGEEFSRMVSRIEQQQMQLTSMASEKFTQLA